MSLLKKGLRPVVSAWQSLFAQQLATSLYKLSFCRGAFNEETGDYLTNSACIFSFLGMSVDDTAIIRMENVEMFSVDPEEELATCLFSGEAICGLNMSPSDLFSPRCVALKNVETGRYCPIDLDVMRLLDHSFREHCAHVIASLYAVDWGAVQTTQVTLNLLNDLAAERLVDNLNLVAGLSGYIVMEAVDLLPDGEIYLRLGELQLSHPDTYFNVSISGELLLDEAGAITFARLWKRHKYAQLEFGVIEPMSHVKEQFLLFNSARNGADTLPKVSPSLHNRELFVDQFISMLLRDIAANFCAARHNIMPAVHPLPIKASAGFGFQPFYNSPALQEQAEEYHSLIG